MSIRNCLRFFIVSILLITCSETYAEVSKAVYGELASDKLISSTVTIIQKNIVLDKASWVYVQSDGRVYPGANGPIAALRIKIDSAQVGNTTVVDWAATTSAGQHSYNIIGAKLLSKGTHVVSLIAGTLEDTYYVGARSNLSVMAEPAASVKVASLASDTGPISLPTAGIHYGDPLPHSKMLSIIFTPPASYVIAMASSRIYEWGQEGDPIAGIYLDGQEQANNHASWAVNDMYHGAEKQAPFPNQSLIKSLSAGNHEFSLDVSNFPYCEDGSCNLANYVTYRVGASSTLVTLSGGMDVYGGAPISSAHYRRADYLPLASSTGWPGVPSTNQDVVIAQADIVVPQGHNGIVLISGKTRIQGDQNDGGGQFYLYLKIDGITRGSLGVQQLIYPNCASERTVTTSFLAAGSQHLSPGTHHVILYGKAQGQFQHLAVTKDLPLIWFD